MSASGGLIDMCSTCSHVEHMSKMIQIRHVPDRLHRRLKARAAAAGMPLSDYLRRELRARRPVIVVDASAVIDLLLRTPAGRQVEARLFDRPAPLHAPHLLDVEVAQVLRRFVARGEVTAERGAASLRLLDAFPLRRHPHAPLLTRMWAL